MATHPQPPIAALLDLLVQTIPGLALVARREGGVITVEHANREAHTAMRRGRDRLVAALTAALDGAPSSFGVGALGGDRFLLVRVPPGRLTAEERLHDLAEAYPNKWALTRRRREVTLWLVQGAANREISEALGLQENTIELHVSAILRQTGADNRTQLVAWFWTELAGAS